MKLKIDPVAQAMPVSQLQSRLRAGLSTNTAAALPLPGFRFFAVGTDASLLAQDTVLLIEQSQGVMQ